MPITYVNNYPNIIIFSPKDPDSIVATYLIKDRYDNNFKNDLWEKNVYVYLVQKDLESASIKEDYNRIEQKIVKDQQNIVFLINPIMDANSILKLWNWCTDKGLDFVWLDNNINNIEMIKHLNIPGKQSSLKSTASLTFDWLNEGVTPPKFFQIFDEAVVEKSEYTFSKEKEALPLYYFVASLGTTLNDNTNSFLFENLRRITSEQEYLKQAIQVGKFVYNYIKLSSPEQVTVSNNEAEV